MLGTPRSSKPSAASETRGGGSIPLAPSNRPGEKMQKYFTAGVAGHVDHGKTTLVRCLTGIDTDRNPEEKSRGVSIESSVAPLPLPSGQSLALIDVPGHTDYLKNAIRGLNSVDLGILVVAVDDGVMPQTREHLEILQFFGARGGLVVLSKTDLVDEETAEIAELEIQEAVENSFLQGRPILKFSMKQPDTGHGVLEALDSELRRVKPRTPPAPFRLWVDQAKHFSGFGTVVSGTVLSGKITSGDRLSLLPKGTPVRARSIQSHGLEIEAARPGQRIGINLSNTPIKAVARGMSLTSPDSFIPGYLLNVFLKVSPRARQALKNRQRVKFHLGTAVVNAMAALMDTEQLNPGDEGLVQIRLLRPLGVCCRDRFVVSLLNRNIVIGGGVVLEVAREKYRQSKAARVVPVLKALQKNDLSGFVDIVFDQNRTRLIPAHALAARSGFAPADLQAAINARVTKGALTYVKGHGAIASANLDQLKSQVHGIAQNILQSNQLRKNVALTEIMAQLEKDSEEVLVKFIADTLCAEGRWIKLDGGYQLADAVSVVDAKHAELIDRLMAYAEASNLTPFSADTFFKLNRERYRKPQIQKTLDYLFSQKKMIRLDDNRFLSLKALEDIKIRVSKAILDKGAITMQDCRSILGYGRWVGTPILDYLDSIGFTVRKGKERFLCSKEDALA